MASNRKDIQQVLDRVTSDPVVRTALLRFLANSIQTAHSISGSGWVVYEIHDGIVFSVKHVYTFTIGIDTSWNTISGVQVFVTEAGIRNLQDQIKQMGCLIDDGFESTPGSKSITIPISDSSNFVRALDLVKPAHEAYISSVLRPGMKTSFKKSYNPSIPKYLRDTLSLPVPDPDYFNPAAPGVNPTFDGDMMKIIQGFLSANGYQFNSTQIASFYTSLQTKGFVILSGISGTGKTKLAQYFAAMLQHRPAALVGAWGGPVEDSNYPEVLDIAEYWDIPIREEVQNSLRPPFRLYINYNNEIRHVFTVRDYRSQPGSTGILTPWPEITDPRLLNRDHEEGKPDKKFKTWFRITRREKLETKFTYAQLQKLHGFSNDPTAMFRGLVPVVDPLAESDNMLFISVRPDWRDSKSLLGYNNPLTKTYEWTAFLDFLIQAEQDYKHDGSKASPWFVLLDEMNLARVEYYFADLLSVLESGRDEDGWTREALQFQSSPEDPKAPPARLKLPPNLYLIGTVNVDETTQSFSPKVLDRAFSLEFTDVDFRSYTLAQKGQPPAFDHQALRDQFTRGGSFAQIDKDEIAAFIQRHPDFSAQLQALNLALQPYSLHFGYRVFDEIMMFLKNAEENGMFGDNLQTAFDQAVLMKVLPKFHGSRGKLEKPLHAVLRWCAGVDNDDTEPVKSALANPEQPIVEGAWQCPAAAKRVLRMIQSLNTTGFASFG